MKAYVRIYHGVTMICMLLLHSTTIKAQTVLRLPEADRIFLEKNLTLLAANYNVSAQAANEIQARLYPNPIAGGEVNAIDPQNNKLFHAGATGQKAFNIEQLLLMGGKRKNAVELARQNTYRAQLELEDLMRNLRLRLHTSFYTVYFDERTVQKYNSQLTILDSIITQYEIQAQKGNVALKEVVRLKSVYLQLNNDKTELLEEIQEEQKNLAVLLQTTDGITPAIDEAEWTRFERLPTIDSLIQTAQANRADWKIGTLDRQIAGINLKYQKSLAVPDVSLGASYDQRGGAFVNQTNLTLSVPLPLWNRNQGNIQMARSQIKIAEVNEQLAQTSIQAEVKSAWYNMKHSLQEYEKTKQVYNADFRDVFNGITDNFRKRNISILEFVDFFESYNETVAQVNRVKKQLAISAEAINYTTAYPIYK